MCSHIFFSWNIFLSQFWLPFWLLLKTWLQRIVSLPWDKQYNREQCELGWIVACLISWLYQEIAPAIFFFNFHLFYLGALDIVAACRIVLASCRTLYYSAQTLVVVHGLSSSGCCCCSVAQSCPTLCDPMDCSTPDFPCPSPYPRICSNLCPLSRWCHPIISSSVVPFSSGLQSFPTSTSFLMSQLFTSGGQSFGTSALVLLLNIQGWFPLGLTGLISLQSKGLSRVFSNTTVQKHQFLLLYGPILTCIHDYWKNHSFDYIDLCWQSNISAF